MFYLHFSRAVLVSVTNSLIFKFDFLRNRNVRKKISVLQNFSRALQSSFFYISSIYNGSSCIIIIIPLCLLFAFE